MWGNISEIFWINIFTPAPPPGFLEHLWTHWLPPPSDQFQNILIFKKKSMYLCQGGSCKIPTIPCLSGYFLITNIKNSQILCSWTIYPLLYNASLLPCMKVMTVNDSYQALSTLPGGEWWQCMKQFIRIRVFVAARHSFLLLNQSSHP